MVDLGVFDGRNYSLASRKTDPTVSLPQAIMSGIAVVAFALGVLAFAIAVTC